MRDSAGTEWALVALSCKLCQCKGCRFALKKRQWLLKSSAVNLKKSKVRKQTKLSHEGGRPYLHLITKNLVYVWFIQQLCLPGES